MTGPIVIVGADAVINDWALISGNTFVGARSFLGAGTTVSNDASVDDDCVIGANSFVRGHLPDGTTAYGAPARPAPLKQRPFRS